MPKENRDMGKTAFGEELDPDVRWFEYLRTSRFHIPTPKDPTIAEYFKLVDAIFGAYLTITISLNGVVDMLERRQDRESRKYNKPVEDLDKQMFSICKVDPSNTSVSPEPENALHILSQGGFKEKNRRGGDNQVMVANMCIVMMYTYWEDNYREKIAHASGLTDRNDVKIDIMGDLGILRNSIIHHGGKMKTDKKCRLLTWFNPGDKIDIQLEQFEDITKQILRALYEYSQKLQRTSNNSRS